MFWLILIAFGLSALTSISLLKRAFKLNRKIYELENELLKYEIASTAQDEAQ